MEIERTEDAPPKTSSTDDSNEIQLPWVEKYRPKR